MKSKIGCGKELGIVELNFIDNDKLTGCFMFFKKIFPIILTLFVIAVAYTLFWSPCVGKINQTYQNGWQDVFDIKVERKPICGFVPVLAGAEYIFSARNGNSENWREIMTIQFDDPIDIPKESIHIFNENTAAVFMIHKYAVTTDKGKTWTVWDIRKDLGLEKFTKFASISKVNFDEDGFAMMNIKAVANTGRDIDAPFITHNFGQTWQVLTK